VNLAFRPHTVGLAATPGAHDRRWIEGDVAEREFLGEFIRYRVRAADVELIVDQQHTLGDTGFAPGASVSIGIDPGQLRLLSD